MEPGITRGVLVAIVCMIFLVAPAWGDESRRIENSSPQEIVDGMAGKGVRGVVNLLTGWVEIPKQISVTTGESGWARGLSIGPLKGIGMAIVRTLTGAGELLTFFVAYPGFYDPWFEPAYVWERE